jgi:hypothetical protein
MGILMSAIEDYKHLWDGSTPAWALVQLNPDEVGEEPRYAIFNTETKRALSIRENEIYAEVKKKMLERVVSIVSPTSGARP